MAASAQRCCGGQSANPFDGCLSTSAQVARISTGQITVSNISTRAFLRKKGGLIIRVSDLRFHHHEGSLSGIWQIWSTDKQAYVLWWPKCKSIWWLLRQQCPGCEHLNSSKSYCQTRNTSDGLCCKKLSVTLLSTQRQQTHVALHCKPGSAQDTLKVLCRLQI